MRQETAVDGFRLAYDRTGEGPAVLLLHGWPWDRSSWPATTCDEGQAERRLRPYMWRRVSTAIQALAAGRAHYLQDGYP